MQPADTVSTSIFYKAKGLNPNSPQALTRMYNQPTKRMPDGRLIGTLYKNPIDCLWKTLQIEGPFGWYKGSLLSFANRTAHEVFALSSQTGSTAHFLRIAPHT